MAHPASRRRNPVIAAVSVLIAGLALAGCSGSEPDSAPPADTRSAAGGGLLAEHELAGLDTPEVIERLDRMHVDDRPSDLLASVQPDALVLSDERQREVELPMPDDEVYVSVAPYRTQTHDCHFHSLTTCEGELGNAPVRVVLTGPGGDVLVDENRETFDNGFVGLWVPRDIEAKLTIEHEGRTGTARIATRSGDDPTCITDLRLT
ncbi:MULTISPECIES: CueP family metal-binding protein [Prauserella salsuginis group]|uniref:Uncharacterized protein n=2 Tax=Prauserella salsuginis group TaxID=2893672 RepID=A0A839XLL5_9PSEU|nr:MULTISPECIES: CueP family metal-binding protein [Prauserella salsuginis group]MBB3661628.1 hypothetical protein [Prauserella sediminis]MCR3719548.1 hypothetical protein [Prauserella flava]MCR3735438.1 hypothetical protein [Prauserella salsuginis]